MGFRLFSSCLALFLLTLSAKADDTAGYVRFSTSVGIINVRLLSEAPLNVANFLTYGNRGSYTDSIIHRSIPGFVFQGGGYELSSSNGLIQIPTNAPVMGEHD